MKRRCDNLTEAEDPRKHYHVSRGLEEGGQCPVCSFDGASLYNEPCWDCHCAIVYCGKCGMTTCPGASIELSWEDTIRAEIR